MENNGKICIIMANIIEDYRDEYIVGIEKQANRLGFSTFTFSMPLLDELHTNNEEAVFDLIDFSLYDGVIFFADSFSAHKGLGTQIEKMIYEKCKQPVIVLGESLLFSETFSENNSIALEMITDHVIEKHGCELLYFLGGQPNQASQNDIGFITSLQKHSLPCTDDNLIYGGYWSECGENLAKDIAYHVVEKPDAVICQDDTVALFFIKALSRYAIRVPEDIIVTGFGARNDSRNNILSITSASCNSEYTGRKTMARLYAMITGSTEPQITPPKSGIITGMSCGCGDCKPADVRLQLERHEKNRMQEIYYNNSQLEEKFFACYDYKDLFPVIMHSSYLIPDKNFLSVNIKADNSTSRCIYLRNHMWDDAPILFNSTELFPQNLSKVKEVNNVHILPITYSNEFLGHIVVGYKNALIYNNIFKKYVKHLALALWNIQKNIALNPNDSDMRSSTTESTVSVGKGASATDTVLVQKDDALHKVPVDSILFFETEGRRTMTVLKNGRYEIKKNLSQLEDSLKDRNFLRVSKSTLVNISKVISFSPSTDRTLCATFGNKITVRVSRKHAQDFKNRLQTL